VSKRRELVRAFRDMDDIVHVFTGKRIKDFVNRAVDLVGDDIKQRVGKFGKDMLDVKNDEIPAAGPYSVLHCRPGCSDAVVKLRFRELARILHPDTGTEPDAKEFQRVLEAYNLILVERKAKGGQNNSGAG
jgi:DnaJ-class molecular chaperone